MTSADIIVRTLLEHDLRTVYCLPGLQSDHLFNAMFDAGGEIRAVHTRHEQGAAYMALGAALATGRPSACSVVPGPGFLNATAALATAYSTNARVLCLAGELPSKAIDRRYGLLHEIPGQFDILQRLTKWADRIATPQEAACKISLAFRHLLSGRPRPVGIEIPPDILGANAELPIGKPLAPEPDPPLDEAALARAASLLAGAERPLIFVGGGALDAGEELRMLAERLQAPVVANRMGRGVLDSRHPLSHTIPGGYRLWRDADVVLAVGTRLQTPQMAWGVDEHLKIIRVEIDPEEISRIQPPAAALVGSAPTVLKRLLAEVDRVAAPRPCRTEEMVALKAAVARDIAVLQPQLSYLAAIREVLPQEGIFVEDLTQVGYVARFAFPVFRPRTYLSSGYQGTLGWGLAAALGAKDALPQLPVVAVCGDGGFMYNVQELATAVRHRIPLVIAIFNDGAFGNVLRMQEELHSNRVIATGLANPDFVRLGESFGICSARARTPGELRSALERAFASGAPALIEVPCGRMPDPWKILTPPRVRGTGRQASN